MCDLKKVWGKFLFRICSDSFTPCTKCDCNSIWNQGHDITCVTLTVIIIVDSHVPCRRVHDVIRFCRQRVLVAQRQQVTFLLQFFNQLQEQETKAQVTSVTSANWWNKVKSSSSTKQDYCGTTVVLLLLGWPSDITQKSIYWHSRSAKKVISDIPILNITGVVPKCG